MRQAIDMIRWIRWTAAAAALVTVAAWTWRAARGWADDFAALARIGSGKVSAASRLEPKGEERKAKSEGRESATLIIPDPPDRPNFTPIELDEFPRRPPIPGTERDYRERFAALARRDPGAFADAVRRSIRGTGPAPERVGALRAARDVLGMDALPLFTEALTRLPAPGDASGESVRRFAGDFLIDRTPPDAAVRAALLQIALDPSDIPADLRLRAVRAAALHAGAAEIPALTAAVAAAYDPDLLAAAAAGLRENGADKARRAAADLQILIEHHPDRRGADPAIDVAAGGESDPDTDDR